MDVDDFPEFDWKAERECEYEERVVGEVVRLLKLKKQAANMAREARMLGEDHISFISFQKAFPDFPVFMTAKKIPYAYKWDLYEIWRKGFTKSPIWKQYCEIQANNPDEERIAMVLTLPGTRYCVFHNYVGGEPSHPALFLQLNQSTYWLEPLKSFLERVKWSPPEN